MRQRSAPKPKAERKKSYGNAGAVERVESQKQASHAFHEPLGNLANSEARFPHFHSSGDDGGWKRAKPEAGFSRSHRHGSRFSQNKKTRPRNGLRPPPGGGRSAPRLRAKGSCR